MGDYELQMNRNVELTTIISGGLTLLDVKENKIIPNKCKEVIIASKGYLRINQRDSEITPKGTKISENIFLETDIETRQLEIRTHINVAIRDSGFGASWSPEEIGTLISSVVSDVLRDFSNLTTQEVGLAFKRGVRDEYGEMKGLSVRLFYRWLKMYCSSSKTEANKVLNKIKIKEKEITQKERESKEKEWINAVSKLFNEFCKTGHYNIIDFNNVLYNKLKGLGLMNISKKEKSLIIKKATQILKFRNNPSKTKSKYERQSFTIILEKINNKDKSIEYLVLKEAKNISLRNYLTKLKDSDKSLKDILTKKTR